MNKNVIWGNRMKISNQCDELVIENYDRNELAQELSGGISGEMIITPGMPELIRAAGAEGCVLLKNDGVLPLKEKNIVSVFGRVQKDYFCVGYGSGGDVLAPYQINLIDGLRNNGKININEELAAIYDGWCSNPNNKVDQGDWGHWPRYYPEMPLKVEIVKAASQKSEVAIVVIGRAAGEDRENTLLEGSYYLTEGEIIMLDQVTTYFNKVVVVMDCGNVIDMEWTEKYGDKISALLYPWQGGMESGNAIVDVLTGTINPCGKLSDTIAREYKDYPSASCFGNKEGNHYIEDIFVGYRYFEIFAPDKVLYPFGYGLSYTTFQITCNDIKLNNNVVVLKLDVTNTGSVSGKEVVQIYCSAPQGKLGKAAKVLIAFGKTELLNPGETTEMNLSFHIDQLASYDDSGVTGKKSAYVLEAGLYEIYAGNSVRDNSKIWEYVVGELTVTEQLNEVMAVKPDKRFKRIVAKNINDKLVEVFEDVPTVHTDLRSIILEKLPKEMTQTGDRGYKLIDVKNKKVTMEEFVAQLSLEELEAISRGEGPMNSPLGASGNAGALGGITESLRAKGIPPVITADGPAGIRIKSTCSLLPCGTLLACTWNTDLIGLIFHKLNEEMIDKEVDMILSPGMNIHRNPLCGRNFEYYSEDPFLTGKIAAAAVNGVQHNGISACPKHFACNNQEVNRNNNDSCVSERALREIYLKGFEIVVKESNPKNIMTSYNKINGVWSHYNYELVTTILREEWGYRGNVVTDWWMQYTTSPEFPEVDGNAYRVRSQVDVLMPGSIKFQSTDGQNDGTLLKNYGKQEGITLGEMQRVATNVLNYVISSSAMEKIVTL